MAKMRDEDKAILRKQHVYLCEELSVEEVLPYLYQEHVLEQCDMERIKYEITSNEKNIKLLDILKTKGPTAFPVFLDALKKVQAHVAETLENTDPTDPHGGGRHLRDLSIAELQIWLRPLLDEKEVEKEKILPVLSESKINGETFATMDKSDFKEVFPCLVFGERERIITIRNENLELSLALPDSPTDAGEEAIENEDEDAATLRKDYFRKFDQTPGLTEKYYKNAKMETVYGRPGNLLDPVHRFVSFKSSKSDDMLNVIGKETVEFAAACMNDRTNGIIHFGVEEQNQDCAPVVHGIAIKKKKCQESILKWILNCFPADQQSTAVKCIHEAKFVEVFDRKNPKAENLLVVEIDIEPKADIVGNAAFFLEMPQSEGKKVLRLFTIQKGSVEALSQKDLMLFLERKASLTSDRKEKERMRQRTLKERNLQTKAVDLLFSGSKNMESSLFHVLVANQFESQPSEQLKKSMEFLGKIDWRCIFDFDPCSSSEGLYHFLADEQQNVYKKKTTDDFDPNKGTAVVDMSDVNEHFDDMQTSSHKHWIFCNGDDEQDIGPLDADKWGMERAKGFRECLRFLDQEFPTDRAVIVFLLLSNNYDVMLESVRDFITTFPNRWVVIAETESILKNWSDHVLKTVRQVTPEMMKERCIVVQRWADMNTVISSLTRKDFESDAVLIPSSTGSAVIVPKQNVQMWSDLEIVGPNECNISESELDSDVLQEKKKDVEHQFYVGHEVSWWNFHFQDHVLSRDCHQELQTIVRDSLRMDDGEDDFVKCFSTVAIYHQPGAGGTTLAKNVLWDLRREYRCCVIRQITKNTAEQIIELRKFAIEDESERKPVLVMVDNQDEEKIDTLIETLKRGSRDNGIQDLTCTLLFCYRRTALPDEREKKKIYLEQKLSAEERQWFLSKYEELMTLYKKNKGTGKSMHPDTLLVLNVMKNNFDPEATERTVAGFVQAIQKYSERSILKYISMLNTYDALFRAIPVHVFDPLIPCRNTGKRWEADMSPHFKMFLVDVHKPDLGGKTKCIRVSNALLCRYVLEAVLKTEDHSQSPAEVFQEFLLHPVLHSNAKLVRLVKKYVADIIKTILKHREPQRNHRPSKFSRLIEELCSAKEEDFAADILKAGFEMTDDPMIAQHIARLYIHFQRWEEAQKYATEATDRCPKNSFLWDTRAQIYKFKLAEIHDILKQRSLTPSDICHAVECAYEAVKIFFKVEYLSRCENSQNTSGQFGALDTVRSLLELLRNLPNLSSSQVAAFMHGEIPVPSELKEVKKEHTEWLKSLKNQVFVTIQNLGEEASRANAEGYVGTKRSQMILQDRDLGVMHDKFCAYFGETQNQGALGTNPGSPQSRRHQAFQMKGYCLHTILKQMRESQEGIQNVQKILQLMIQNLKGKMQKGKNQHPLDLHMALGSSFALAGYRCFGDVSVQYEDVLQWSAAFYESPPEKNIIDLDRYIFFTILHWYTKVQGTLQHGTSDANVLEAVERWKKAYQQKYPGDKDGQMGSKAHFFLTKNPGLLKVVHFDYLRRQAVSGQKKTSMQMHQRLFHSAWAKENLLRFPGILQSQGKELVCEMPLGKLTLPLSCRVTNSLMWRKRVSFVVGFCIVSPAAYDVCEERWNTGPARR